MKRKISMAGAHILTAEEGEDLRDYTPEGRLRCTTAKPWDQTRESAPYGVQHEGAETNEDGSFECPACGFVLQ